MAKDMKGYEVGETDVIQLQMTASHITGSVQEIRIVGKGARARGYMRVAFQYEVPFKVEQPIVGMLKVGQMGEYVTKKKGLAIAKARPSLIA